MVISQLEESARRLEQQLTAFERLHADELKRFQDQLETYRRLQNDELQMLRNELSQLKDELVRMRAQEPEQAQRLTVPHTPAERAPSSITRRDLITGHLRPSDQAHGPSEE